MNALHMTKMLFQFKKAKLPLWTGMLNVTVIDKRKISLFLLLSIVTEILIIIIKVANQGSDLAGSDAALMGNTDVFSLS